MPSRTIPTAASLPPLTLPDGALSRRDHQYSYDVKTDPPGIEPIEHKLRADFMTAGPPPKDSLLNNYGHAGDGTGNSDPWEIDSRDKPLAIKYAEQSLIDQWELEKEWFKTFPPQSDPPSEYLKHIREQCGASMAPENKFVKEAVDRKKWYCNLIPRDSLYPVFSQSSVGKHIAETGFPTYIGVLVVSDTQSEHAASEKYDTPKEYIRAESELKSSTNGTIHTPSEYGIDLPAPLLLGRYQTPTKTSEYLLIPWSSGLVCQGPFKQSGPHRVCCKHEFSRSVQTPSRRWNLLAGR